MTTIVQIDTDNAFNWERIEQEFDGDILLSKTTFYDNGQITFLEYLDGLVVRKEQIDALDNGGVASWERIETRYEVDGSIAEKFTILDNGIYKLENFEDGQRRRVEQFDNPEGSGNAKSWDRIETDFSADGTIEYKTTFYDNGIIHDLRYESGVQAELVQYDNPQDGPGGGAKSWDRIETRYDSNGAIAEKVTFNDNGVIVQQAYQNGVIAQSIQMDNPQGGSTASVKSWDRIETNFDETGQRVDKVTFFDNGIIREEYYNAGQRVFMNETDNPQNPDQSAASWSNRQTEYEADGTIAFRLTEFDDGRLREETFENGKLKQSVTLDNPYSEDNAYSWEFQFTIKDENGQNEASGTAYDNGDLLLHLFDAGTKMLKGEFDGDGSEDWLARETLYDTDGAVVDVSLIYTEADLPSYFQDELVLTF